MGRAQGAQRSKKVHLQHKSSCHWEHQRGHTYLLWCIDDAGVVTKLKHSQHGGEDGKH